MNELTRLGREVQKFCEARKWQFCFIGGLAVQHWGEPRYTQDVDLTLFTGFGNEPAFINELLLHFRPRVADPEIFSGVCEVVCEAVYDMLYNDGFLDLPSDWRARLSAGT